MSFSFQKLDIYQLSKNLVCDVYRSTQEFPDCEKYALVQQLNRAVVSVPSNIAEGSSRYSSKERIRFMNISYGSLMEVVCQLDIAKDLGYISINEFREFELKSELIAKKIAGYIRAMKKSEENSGVWRGNAWRV